MNDLLQFKKNAKERELCENYTSEWNNSKSKKDLVKIATDSNGAPYMCESITAGWGLSADYINNNFNDYCDGSKIEQRGYTSSMLCKFNDIYKNTSTILLVINCNCNIEIDTRICEIFVCDGSNITIINDLGNKAIVHLYGNSTCNKCNGIKIKKGK